MRLRNIWVSTLGLALAASIVACGGGSVEQVRGRRRRRALPAAQKVDTATAGDVKGMATLDGTGADERSRSR